MLFISVWYTIKLYSLDHTDVKCVYMFLFLLVWSTTLCTRSWWSSYWRVQKAPWQIPQCWC